MSPPNENKNVRVKEWLETVAYKLTAVRRLIFLPIALAHFVFFRKKGHHLINFYFLGFPVSSTDIVLSIYFVCVSFVIITRRF